jgi:hypothetical protein
VWVDCLTNLRLNLLVIKKIGSFMDATFWRGVKGTVRKFENRHPLIRLIIGFSLVVIGITGIILPVMPGWIFLIPGLVLLFPFSKKWLDKKK